MPAIGATREPDCEVPQIGDSPERNSANFLENILRHPVFVDHRETGEGLERLN